MAALQRKLGPGDRTKVSQYLDSVREIERRIQLAEQQNGGRCRPIARAADRRAAAWEDHVKLMFDLQVLALQADITRVITFQLAREVSTRTYPQIGVPEAHHPTSHHQNDPEKIAKLAKINAYHVSLFAYFLDKLKVTPDGDGSLLDHSLYCSAAAWATRTCTITRSCRLLVAGGGPACKGGRHISYCSRYADDEPAVDHAGQGGRGRRHIRRQHGQIEELL